VVTEIGARCTSGVCSPAQNTAFPRSARGRKGEVGGKSGGPPGLEGPSGFKFQDPSRPPRASRPPDLKTFWPIWRV
jgi:hypothetical protein